MTTKPTNTAPRDIRDIRNIVFSVFDNGTREIGFLPIGTKLTNQWGKIRTVIEHVSEKIDFTPDCPPWG